jgi:hypothetical protein
MYECGRVDEPNFIAPSWGLFFGETPGHRRISGPCSGTGGLARHRPWILVELTAGHCGGFPRPRGRS